METLGPAGMYRGEQAARRLGPPINPYGGQLDHPDGFRPLSNAREPGAAPMFQGYNAHTRHNITQIYFGCQNVMIYAAEGHVELLLSMDPSGNWQPITPDAAEELGHQLIRAGQAARANARAEQAKQKEDSTNV